MRVIRARLEHRCVNISPREGTGFLVGPTKSSTAVLSASSTFTAQVGRIGSLMPCTETPETCCGNSSSRQFLLTSA